MTQTAWRITAPLVAIIILAAIIYFFGVKPINLLNAMEGSLQTKDYLELRGNAMNGLAQALGGAILFLGLFFTWRNVRATEANIRATQVSTAKSLAIAEEGQITERFTRAIEHLGNRGSLATRLGGIYALERIAADSERDHWPVMEILTTYVREHAEWKEQTNQIVEPLPGEQDAEVVPAVPSLLLQREQRRRDPIPPLPKDIQAILTVLGRRNISYETGKDRYLDLRHCDLAEADLALAHLEHTVFFGVHLEGSVLRSAHLEDATFIGAYLEAADLSDADLAEADFSAAHLNGAVFNIARAKRSDFSNASLMRASFWNTELNGATFVLADARNANFEDARLTNVNFENAALEGSSLRNASMAGANFLGANLQNADLDNADLTDAYGLTLEQVTSAYGYGSARLPKALEEAIHQTQKTDPE